MIVDAAPAAPRPRRRRALPWLPAAAIYTVCGLLALLFVAPVAWLVLASFKSGAEFAQSPPTYLPDTWSLENYRRLIDAGLFRNVANSALAAAGTVVTATVLSVLAGYGFARLRLRSCGVLFLVVLSTLMIPFQSIVPSLLYLILDNRARRRRRVCRRGDDLEFELRARADHRVAGPVLHRAGRRSDRPRRRAWLAVRVHGSVGLAWQHRRGRTDLIRTGDRTSGARGVERLHSVSGRAGVSGLPARAGDAARAGGGPDGRPDDLRMTLAERLPRQR
ncbi:hypothetical protein [Micromonospora sp. WMMD980]|uniref:carbohydrate ABC transporter permease n=1 Tax=Micromonospora sp. WMMD980 TaxID=3016088 RepID=UPI002415F8FB|nr:hypothetical protein [Micromonospora sp. WMMD980]MDG4800026.1 hypothetical protein [Micromonospora sp. WMMD980]